METQSNLAEELYEDPDPVSRIVDSMVRTVQSKSRVNESGFPLLQFKEKPLVLKDDSSFRDLDSSRPCTGFGVFADMKRA